MIDILLISAALIIAAFGLVVVALSSTPPCDHEMRTHTHPGTGRKYCACRCGLFFRRVS